MTPTFITVAAVGYTVLIGAIMLNVFASALGIITWYGFLESVAAQGVVGGLRQAGVISITYLFVLYPLLLGWMAWGVMRWVGK